MVGTKSTAGKWNKALSPLFDFCPQITVAPQLLSNPKLDSGLWRILSIPLARSAPADRYLCFFGQNLAAPRLARCLDQPGLAMSPCNSKNHQSLDCYIGKFDKLDSLHQFQPLNPERFSGFFATLITMKNKLVDLSWISTIATINCLEYARHQKIIKESSNYRLHVDSDSDSFLNRLILKNCWGKKRKFIWVDYRVGIVRDKHYNYFAVTKSIESPDRITGWQLSLFERIV